MNRASLGISVFVALLAAGSANAVQYTWDLESSAVIGPQDAAACGPSGNTANCQLTFNSTFGNLSLLARAYSTLTANINSSTNPTGTLISGNIQQYSNGLGVNNVSGESGETTNPEHALDNKDRYDLIVFEAPTANFNWEELTLGWYSNDSDVQLWTGNGSGAGMDFSSMCLTSTGTGCSTSNSIADQFASLGTFNNVGTGSINLNTNDPSNNKTGRYLVVSGALGLGSKDDYFDAFKISSLKGIPGVPEPHSMALLGLGMLAMVSFVRRKAK